MTEKLGRHIFILKYTKGKKNHRWAAYGNLLIKIWIFIFFIKCPALFSGQQDTQ